MSAGNRKYPQYRHFNSTKELPMKTSTRKTIIAFIILLVAGILIVGCSFRANAAQPKTWKKCETSSSLNCVHDGGKSGPSYMRWLRNAHHPEKVTLKFISSERARDLLRG